MKLFCFRDFIYLFLEKGEGGKKMERNHSPGLCPDEQSKHQPFALRYDAQATEPHQSGLKSTS